MIRFVYFILIFDLLFLFSYGKKHYIACGQCEEAIPTSFAECLVEAVGRNAKLEKKKVTASKPKFENTTSWYIFKDFHNQMQLAFNLTWSQTGKQFSNTEGFYLSITSMNTAVGGSDFRKFSFSSINKTSLHHSDTVFINYPCYGKEPKNFEKIEVKLKPKLYYIYLKSLPTYYIKSSAEGNKVETYIDIDCEYNKKISHLSICETFDNPFIYRFNNTDTQAETTEIKPASSSEGARFHELAFLLAFSVALILFLLFSMFLIMKYSIKRRGFIKNSSILLLISTFDKEDNQDHHYLKAADMLCDILKQNGDVDVITNIWNDVNISEPLEWFDENVKNCKHIVLVCTPLGKKNWMKKNMNDMFVMGYQMYRMQRIKKRWFSSSSHKFSLICLDANSKVCIPDEMSKDKIKYQNIKVSLPSFFKKVTGKKLCTNLKNVVDFQEIVQSIQLNVNEREAEIYDCSTFLLVDEK